MPSCIAAAVPNATARRAVSRASQPSLTAQTNPANVASPAPIGLRASTGGGLAETSDKPMVCARGGCYALIVLPKLLGYDTGMLAT